MTGPVSVLFLCTGNSARSILGEVLARELSDGRLEGYSAGSTPKGQVHPGALRLLARKGYSSDGLRSKAWGEFAEEGAPHLDIIITVCDNAAGEACPIWPGRPASAHWGLPDPADAQGEAAEDEAFELAHEQLSRRITALLELSDEQLRSADLKPALQAIDAAARQAEGRD